MQLVISNLSKKYPNGVQALNNVSLTIKEGMFGLLGPNGAGKSSLMRTIATLQEADSGSIFLDDLDVLKEKEAVRKILGYLPQDFGVYPKISSEQMLDHIACLKGLLRFWRFSSVIYLFFFLIIELILCLDGFLFVITIF